MPSEELRGSLAAAIAGRVPGRTQAKGTSYFHSGAVVSIEGNQDHVVAVVEGTTSYRVEITREDDGFVCSCDCPFLEDRLEICKHVWATVLAADARGLLRPTSDHSWIDVDPLEPVDTYLPDTLPLPRQPPPRPARWEQVLTQLSSQLQAPAAPPVGSRYRDAQLIYAVNADGVRGGQGVPILLLARQRKKSGDWGQPQPAAIKHEEIEALPDESDREILPLLLGASDPYGTLTSYPHALSGNFALLPPLVHALLPRIARTGRLFLRHYAAGRQDLVPLSLDDGPAWTFEVEAASDAEGGFVVDGSLVREGGRLRLDEPQLLLAAGYLVAAGRLARFERTPAMSLLTELRGSGTMRVPQSGAPRLAELLARFQVDPAALPEALRYDVVEVPPRPRVNVSRAGAYATYGDLRATVGFDYDGSVAPPDMRPVWYEAERRQLIRRDVTAEATALERLKALGVRRTWPEAGNQFSVTLNAFPRAVRTLVAEGWHVEADGRLFRTPQAMSVQVKSGVDWFELHGSVDFGEGRSATIAALLASLRSGADLIVLDDGSQGMVPDEWLRKYLRMASFGETSGDHIRYRKTQAAVLDALLEGQPAICIDEVFARARVELRRFSGVTSIDPPSTFRGTLREYQREALGWFDFLRRFGFGGCLADDMGLGKTVMVLALLDARRTAQDEPGHLPSLAVVPRSLVFNWTDEAARFAPSLRVLDYTGTARDLDAIPEHDLVLTTYGTLRRDAAELTKQSFDYVILDEAQAIKNPSTVAAKAVRLLRGRHRLALTGTPIENHVGELWSLFEFLNPGVLGSSSAFKKVSALTRGDRDDLAVVTRAVKPMILRRTKAQVEPQLPARTEQTILCELDGPQRKFYDKLRDHYRATLMARVAHGGLARAKLQVLEALLRLRQAACHPGLVDPARAGESSAKLDTLIPQLAEVTGEGHKALVFSQFTSFLALVRERLDRGGMLYEYLDGQTKDRAACVRRFNEDPDCRVFLISLKAGGVGLNLTAAEYVFLLDPWWNPAVEAQAIDRAHRIGQSRHVFAYRLIARDTVEEKVAELQQQKRELADAILTADPALIRTLSADDLEWLLE